MFGLTRKPRFDVEEARRRERAVQRVEAVTEELCENAEQLKQLVARMREEPNEGEQPGD